MDRFTDILFVLLGWLLGTLTPGIQEAIRRPKRRTELLGAVHRELFELRYKLALVAHRMRGRSGTMSENTFALVRPIIMEYHGAALEQGIRESMTKLLANGEAQYIALHNSRKGEGSPYPVPYEMPFLDSHLQDLDLFPPSVQERLLRLRAEFHLFNEQVGQVQLFHDRSYTLAGDNHKRNSGNYESGLEKLANRAETVIREINSVLEQA